MILEAKCPVDDCPYKSLGRGREVIIEDIRRHVFVFHGIRVLSIGAIEIREIDVDPISGCP